MMKKKHIFITIEGGEGSGKTTQSLLLKKFFEQKNYEVLLTREPGGTVLAEAIRRILLNPGLHLVPLSELFLYEAARAQHMKELVIPSLKSGKVVICDRFTDATVAYQGYGRKLSVELINKLNFTASFGISPTLTIHLDIVPFKGLTKAKKLNKESYGTDGDRIERESIRFHNSVRNGYLSQAKKYPKRIKVVKTQKTPEETQDLIREIIGRVLYV
ncbi:thymidylate kinase [Endomicrobiia bacterium]|nr:thymidylate kinase [Endomicrobiia bacterium]GHT65461.1 thymidylate kinase [Endomicrobiia bacterium]GHT69962.1 thymidylate kinase [Endomicrobiia bacterium]GHT73983.1 thymidylate kinase [Endomicrobiia bacterium]